MSHVRIQFPEPFSPLKITATTADSFNVSAQGNGSFTGLAYTVPAHTKGKISAQIQTLSMTTADIQNLNALIEGMVSASAKHEIKEYERTHASADLSWWSFWSAGGSASYEKTRESMESSGLTEAQVSEIITKMLDIASNMSKVQIEFEVDNLANDYKVSGSLLLYTIAGTISSGNDQAEYRMLANEGTAGSDGSEAPASGDIIPLN